MLNGFLRTAILFLVTAVALRLMGKRQLAQLQPYEVVITLMISDLATLPMSDVEIPLLSGVVSILTLLLLHSLLPPNDGGICVGQAAFAMYALQER